MRTLDEAVPDVKIENSGNVMMLLSQTINQVLKGIIDPRVAKAVGYLANLQIKTFELNELEKRLAKLGAERESRMAALSRVS